MADSESPALVELHIGGSRPVRTATLARHGVAGLQFRRNERAPSLRLWKNLKSAFLPEGYPNSVTADYLPFQTWDTLQGLSTYIRSMLSTQACRLFLEGLEWGNQSNSSWGNISGMLGGILFTLCQGSNLDSSAKQWRLAADLLNDMGMLMDLISPLFPGSFLMILCIGSIARAITGTASGATRAALTQHFALRQNAADVQAKEGSQETAATMVGMMLGMVVAQATASNAVAMAVRSLCLSTLNPERTSMLLRSFVSKETVPTPKELSVQERVLPQLPKLAFSGLWQARREWTISIGSRISALKPSGGWESFTRTLTHQYRRHLRQFKTVSGDMYMLYGWKEMLETNHVIYNGDSAAVEKDGLTWMETSFASFLNSLQASGWVVNRIHISAGEWRADWPVHLTGDEDLDFSREIPTNRTVPLSADPKVD